MSNEYTPSLDNLSLQYALSKDPGDGRTTEEWWAIRDAAQAEFDRAINKIRAEAIRAAGEAMEYALSFDDTYVHNSWLQDYAVNLEEQA